MSSVIAYSEAYGYLLQNLPHFSVSGDLTFPIMANSSCHKNVTNKHNHTLTFTLTHTLADTIKIIENISNIFTTFPRSRNKIDKKQIKSKKTEENDE